MILSRSRSRIAVAGLAAAAVLAATFADGASARRGCGDVERVPATKQVNPGGAAPLAVGDSVMLLALHNLAAVGYDTNGQGCRSFAEGLGVVRSTRRAAKLPRLVVLALGTDGRVSMGQIKKALRIVGPERVLGLVTPNEFGGGAGFDASVMRKAAGSIRPGSSSSTGSATAAATAAGFSPTTPTSPTRAPPPSPACWRWGRGSRGRAGPARDPLPPRGAFQLRARGPLELPLRGMRVTIGGSSHADRLPAPITAT